jgi:alpha-D-ribose 1-methylphosphonate 5-triphosphate synthase subunit PhnG
MLPEALVEPSPLTALRQRAHAIVAKSKAASVRALFDRIAGLPVATPLRPTEVGLVMVRGRVGGDGQRFNLGELPVTRAAVKFSGGPVGIGYVAGRDPAHAEMAALADAMVQTDAWREKLEDGVLAPLAAELAADKDTAARKAAATKVDFFTMVRTRAEK